jgi:two-component system, OmpR family, phosphate regulon sensor histidine kinase PhoR
MRATPSIDEVSTLFQRCQGELIEHWREQARRLPHARFLDRPTLTDHLPELVAEITTDLALRRDGELAGDHAKGSPPVHGVQRFHDGFDLGEVVAEYHLLRDAFQTIAERHGMIIQGEAARIVNRRVDQAIGLAVKAFAAQQALVRRRQQEEHLAFFAHDLQTPLNAVSLVVDELEANVDPEERERFAELFRILSRNVQRVGSLVHRVLQTNMQISDKGGAFRPELRHFELWPLIQRLVLDLGPLAARQAVTVQNRVPRILTVNADAGLVSQAFQNLLDNAFKYAPGGRITIAAHAIEGLAVCSVEDDGEGIPPDSLPRIFDRRETDPRKDGTGLGLAIVKEIVEAHGGTVSASSVPGDGARFTLTLPLADES